MSTNSGAVHLAIAGLFLFSKQKGADTLHNLIVTEKPSVARTISKVLASPPAVTVIWRAAAGL